MESFLINLRNQFNQQFPDMNEDTSPLSSSQQTRDFRQVELPKTKMGLASSEGELIVLLKKYLEVVGMVFFVWLLGECT